MTRKDNQTDKPKNLNNDKVVVHTSAKSPPASFKGWLLVVFTALLIVLWYYWYLTVAPKQIAPEPKEFFKKTTSDIPLVAPILPATNVHEPHKYNTNAIKLEQISLYRDYLREVNGLVIKFLQGKIYESELHSVLRPDLPEKIEKVLKDLKDYNIIFVDQDNKHKDVIFPKYFRIIEKFVSIEKDDKLTRDAEDLRHKIIDQLSDFTDYFYSPEFQQKFIDEWNND